jgi:type II secretory pathway component GspD/PulD (secretin)
MTSALPRQAASWLTSFLLLAASATGQSADPSPQNPQAATPVRPSQPGDLKRAQKAAEQGDKAAAAGRFEEALAAYDEAARIAPQDLAILERDAALRSKLVRDHVEAAERDALAGHADLATEELAAAIRIDPGNTVVAERMAQMKAMRDEPAAKPEKGIEGMPQLTPQAGKRNLNLRGDTKTVYQQVGEMFGIKAAFDPELTPRPVRLRVDDVDFFTALTLLGMETGTFWRPVSSTLIFIAQDTLEKRRQYGVQAEQTFVLPSSIGPEDMTELLRILREITGATHIQLDSAARTITIRDTPEQLKLAGELIVQVEKARGEVMLEIEILEVDRDKAQILGVTPPSSAKLITLPTNVINQLEQAKDLNTLITLLAAIFGNGGSAAGANIASLIPPLMLVGGGKTTFLLTLPAAAAQFSDALTLVHSGNQVLLRAQDGKPASFFVGDRFPVTLTLLSGSIGTTSFVPAVSNSILPSTNYDVGVGPVGILAADFRGVGQLDLAVINEIDNTLTILQNQGGNGTFIQATGSPIQLGTKRPAAPVVAPSVASAVLTNTGFPDLLITDPDTNTVLVLLSNGDDTFKAATGSPIAVGKEPSAVVTADFNGDGKPDFAVANFADNTVSIFLGNGDGTFTRAPKSPFALPNAVTGPVAMVTSDFNLDGKVDLAIVNRTTNNLTILLGNGDGTFTEATGSPITVGKTPVAIASADFNGDSKPDLAVLNQGDNSVSILLNNGDATFAAAPNSPLATGQSPTGIAVADFAANGNVDIAVTSPSTNSVSVFLGLGQGLFAAPFELPVGTNPTAILAASLASGSLPDVAVTDNPAGTIGQVTVILSPASLLPGGAAGNVPEQPYPASEYIDLGVKIKATPTIHRNNDVTLQLEFEIRSLSGSSVNGIPIITNRTLSQTVRLKEDETSVIGGLLDQEETRTLSGLPGFAKLPAGLGYAFGQRNNTSQDTELLILITPRRLRLQERNARSIFIGHDGAQGRGTTSIRFPSARPGTEP